MLINMRNAMMAGKRLPYDAEVEYLESTGTQWIDTSIVPTLYTKSEVVAKFTTVSGPQICGAYWSGVNNAFDICGVANNSWFLRALTSGSPNPSGWTADTNTHTFVSDAQTNTMSVDGVSVTRSAISIGTPVSIYLFARHERSTGVAVTYPCQVKIYSVRFYDSNVLVRDFIPVRFTNELGQSEGAMYDRVSGTLFRNRGTGAFVIGPDK
ncbi:MAG: hypothetical protein IIW14_03410 [Kiritimatiellae bacterium]|nr:hypothetical protein [Kiritimatiellia bacterium]